MQQTAHVSMPHTAGFAHPSRAIVYLPIETGMRVADFGAGSGHYIVPMAQRVGDGGHVYAVDVQQDLLKRIHTDAHKRGLKNVSIIWADLEKPNASKLGAGAMDLVLISNLLFQVDDANAVMREAKRVLKPSGTLAVIDWSASYNMMGPHKDHVVTKAAGIDLLHKNGFEHIHEFEPGAHHWGLLARPRLVEHPRSA